MILMIESRTFELRTSINLIMKKLFYASLFLVLVLISCKEQDGKDDDRADLKLPRVAIAGIAIESSTFSPARTHEEAFHADIGEAVFGKYPFLSADSLDRKRALWFPALQGHALPGGMVTREEIGRAHV